MSCRFAKIHRANEDAKNIAQAIPLSVPCSFCVALLALRLLYNPTVLFGIAVQDVPGQYGTPSATLKKGTYDTASTLRRGSS